jgi:nucleoside-triphosphatase THEP1
MNNLPKTGNSGTPEVHPAVHQHIASFSDALNERDALRVENQNLRSHVQVLETSLRELQYQLDAERISKERYQRYAVTVQTLNESIARAAEQAHKASLDFAIKEEAKPLPSKPKPLSEVEAEVQDLVNKLGTSES